jgi:hypothetical protein
VECGDPNLGPCFDVNGLFIETKQFKKIKNQSASLAFGG